MPSVQLVGIVGVLIILLVGMVLYHEFDVGGWGFWFRGRKGK